MEKQYEGGVNGRSATLFTAAFSQETGTGTDAAMEDGTHRVWFDYGRG